MVEELSQARTQPRSIVQQRTSAGRWPSLLLRVVCASVHLSSFPMPLVFPSHCQ